MKKQSFALAALPVLVLTLFFTACQPERLEEPAPFSSAVLQGGSEIGRSDTPETTDEGEGLPPQAVWPNPLPTHALVKRLAWSDIDFQRLTYNDQGQVAQLHSQWQFVQNDPTQIRQITYDFQYDAQHKLAEVTSSDGPVTKYFYQGDRIQKVQQIIPGTGLEKEENTYTTSNGRIVQGIRRLTNLATGETTIFKLMFGYDAKGNLNKVDNYVQEPGQPFKWYQTFVYSDFDNKMNTTSWMLRTPYLPQIRWQINNPGKMTLMMPNLPGKVTTYTYTYNQQGLPASKTTMESGVSLRVFYQY